MKIRFFQGFRLGELQPCQVAVLLQQLTEDIHTGDILPAAKGFVPQGAQRLTPTLCKAWGSTALGQHPCREVYSMNEESKG